MAASDYYCTRNDCYQAGASLKGVSYLIVHSPSVYPVIIRAASGSGGGWYKRWNKPGVEKLVHGFIDDTGVYEFAPPSLACWQIGDGWGNANCIGYELCELDTAEEFQKLWDHAVSHYAALCKRYGLTADRVLGHYEAHERGFASNHDDPAPYFARFGKTMADFRAGVEKILSGGDVPAGGTVTIVKTYSPAAHGTVKNLSPGETLNVRTGPDISYGLLSAWPRLDQGNETDVFALYSNGWAKVGIRGAAGYVNSYYLEIREAGTGSYPVWVGKASGLDGLRLNVRTGPGTSYDLLPAWPKLSEGNLVDVTGENGDWYQVRIAGKAVGWVSKAYLARV